MEMLVIASGAFLGYILNKNGKNSRMPNKDSIVAANDIPNGANIYRSDRTKEVKDHVQSLANEKYKAAIKQRYPLEYNKPQTVIPSDPMSGIYTPLVEVQTGASTPIAKSAPFVSQLAFDPATGAAIQPTVNDIDNAPMFRAFKGTISSDLADFGAPISLLSGAPTDFTHGNMQARGNFNNVSEANSQVLLEKFTGVASSTDMGTYRQKKEIVNSLPNNPETVQRANLNAVTDSLVRAQSVVKPTHEYTNPIKPIRDTPLKTDLIRILPKDIDATRNPLNSHVTYEGRVVQGQKGSTRGMIPTLQQNTPVFDKERGTADFIPNRSIFDGYTNVQVPTIRTLTSTEEYANEYTGAPISMFRSTAKTQMADAQIAKLDVTVDRKQQVYTPNLGIANAPIRGKISTGTLMVKDVDTKDKSNDYISAPFKNVGSTDRSGIRPLETTLKDLMTDSGLGGDINPSGRKVDGAYMKENFENLATTNKAMTSENKWKGQPHLDLGMGFSKQDFEPWVTTKETTQTSSRGNAKGCIPAHMSYESVFTDLNSKEAASDRFGIARGTVSGKRKTGELMDNDFEELLVIDHVNSGVAPRNTYNKSQYKDGMNREKNNVEFGGYLHNAKTGKTNESATRHTSVKTKTENLVEGRMNVGLQRDVLADREIGVALKSEKLESTRKHISRTQPKLGCTVGGIGIQVRSKNSEALNPRMDPDVKITSDLFPYVRPQNSNDESSRPSTPIQTA